MLAERETADRLIANFLADRIGATFEGRISGVTRAGLFVKLRDTGADGFIPARTIGDDYFHFDERRHAMIGRRSGEIYRLGDSVIVKLIEAAPVAGALRFELVSEGRFDGPRRASYQDERPHYRRNKDNNRNDRSKHKRKKQRKNKGKRRAS
jgi:ribonuclease R